MGPIACERKIYAENHASYKQPKKHLFPDRVGWKVSQQQNGFQSMSKTKRTHQRTNEGPPIWTDPRPKKDQMVSLRTLVPGIKIKINKTSSQGPQKICVTDRQTSSMIATCTDFTWPSWREAPTGQRIRTRLKTEVFYRQLRSLIYLFWFGVVVCSGVRKLVVPMGRHGYPRVSRLQNTVGPNSRNPFSLHRSLKNQLPMKSCHQILKQSKDQTKTKKNWDPEATDSLRGL